jgi:hypothetical protein
MSRNLFDTHPLPEAETEADEETISPVTAAIPLSIPLPLPLGVQSDPTTEHPVLLQLKCTATKSPTGRESIEL